jgi:hypothetical protein
VTEFLGHRRIDVRLAQTVCLAAVTCVVLFVLPLSAQSPNGTINGLVLDPVGRAIAGADIVIVNDVTAVKYSSKTNDEGIYVVPNLPPGPYRLQVSKVGFKTLIKPDIVLNVQDAISISFTLSIGASIETVTVEGGAPLVNTESATVSTVVDRQFAENLPLNGRSFQTLIYLTPGVVATPSTQFESGQFSVNGQRPASNYWMVDGVSANVAASASQIPGNGLGGALGSTSALGGTNSLVSVDAMQEFRIQTSTFAPEFGRTPGGQISIVTRSGTNQFHGVAFNYLRNEVLDANNWFNGFTNNPPLPKAKERQNDFGGTFSGPILPSRTFFFFSYEGLRLRLPQTTLSNVPDMAARQSAVPGMRPYLDAYPLPNGSDNPVTGIAQFNQSYSNPASLDAYGIRIDHRVGSRLAVFGRYSYSPSSFAIRGTNTGFGALSSVQSNKITPLTATGSATWMVTSSLTNDLRFNYSRTSAGSHFFQDDFGGAIPLATLPFPQSVDAHNGQFSMTIIRLGVGQSILVGQNAKTIQRQVNIVDNVALQHAAHDIKFGIDFRRLAPIFEPYTYGQNVLFLTVPASASGTNLRGQISSRENPTLLFRNIGLFAQDTWHALPKLTLTYGLRWDLDLPPSSLDGPSIPAVIGYNLTDFSQLGFAPPGTAPFRSTYGNVAPRLGIAYQAFQSNEYQTVIRGGFGVFYDLVSSETGNLLNFVTPPFGDFRNVLGSPFPFTASQVEPVPIAPNGVLTNLDVFNPHLRLPYTLQWNIAIEEGLGNQQAISATYIGAIGRRLLQSTTVLNPPTNQSVQNGVFVDNTSSSDYHALQLQFHRRFASGVQALASYTLSHSIDDASAGSYGNPSNRGIPGATSNRGSSDFDIRHGFTAAVTYDVPSPRFNGIAHDLLGGWSVQNLILARSAPPVDLSDFTFSLFDSGISANIRPDLVPGQPLYLSGSQYPGSKAFNPAAFTHPPVDPTTGRPLRQGNLGRNTLRGFGAFQWDFAVHRKFTIHEPLKLEFRAELFNILNHPNFGPPNGQFGTTGFGVSDRTLAQNLSGGNLGGGGLSPLYQIGGPRSIQVALKLSF